jgi:hypothetical protein
MPIRVDLWIAVLILVDSCLLASLAAANARLWAYFVITVLTAVSVLVLVVLGRARSEKALTDEVGESPTVVAIASGAASAAVAGDNNGIINTGVIDPAGATLSESGQWKTSVSGLSAPVSGGNSGAGGQT